MANDLGHSERELECLGWMKLQQNVWWHAVIHRDDRELPFFRTRLTPTHSQLAVLVDWHTKKKIHMEEWMVQA
jgi:hypothetical protein